MVGEGVDEAFVDRLWDFHREQIWSKVLLLFIEVSFSRSFSHFCWSGEGVGVGWGDDELGGEGGGGEEEGGAGGEAEKIFLASVSNPYSHRDVVD